MVGKGTRQNLSEVGLAHSTQCSASVQGCCPRNPHGFLFSSQNRTDQQCQYRWLRVLNPDLVKGPWTKEEDQKVTVGQCLAHSGLHPPQRIKGR